MDDDRNQQPDQGVPRDNLAPPKADFSAPPPYELTNSNESSMQGVARIQQQQENQSPIITQNFGKLPTYEEVQMEKTINGEFMHPYMHLPTHMNTPPPPNPLLANITGAPGGDNINVGQTQGPRALTFIAIDAATGENLSSNDNNLLGSDIMFITAFVVAFLFNWIGFLMLTCFCHTIAARYGALSGFGLSLAKWTLIVKHSTELVSHDNSWLWWLIMAFGFLICIRALIQYVSIKRTWRLLSTSAQERLLFFY